MSLDDLRTHIRPELARASPYRWQEGIPDGPVDRFDMNTPADPPAWYAASIARLAAIPPNDYPDASYLPLKRAIAGYAGVGADQVVVGAGCDEVLALCAQLALGRGDTALVAKPTYQLYTVASRNAGAEVLALAPGDGLALDREGLVHEAAKVRVVWLCSPNNPTGEQLDGALVERICDACPGIVVLDQAYLELGGEDFGPLVERHANLVVTRTFSKGFALGAARVGYGLAQPALAEALDALRPPGSISSWSAAVAEIACRETEELHERCAAIVEERGHLAAGMRSAGVEVLAQAGNFVLARSPVPDLFTRLVERGCAVRTFAHEPLLAGCFRVTVSHRDANGRLLRALAELAGGNAPEALALKIAGGRGPLAVMVNGVPLTAQPGRRTFFFTPDGPGFARLTVMDARGATDSVTVRLQ
jgi:histidinol-phosphate aminotransferase